MRYSIICNLFLLFPSLYVTASPVANNVDVDVVTDQLQQPWSLAFLPNDSFLVTEKKGQLRIVNRDGGISQPIQGVPSVAAVGQGGLLDVILHPEFEKNSWIYLSYSAGSAVRGYSTEVIRAELTNQQLFNTRKIFTALPKTKGGRHFSGKMVFRKENDQHYLYLGLGDRGVRSQAQDVSNHHGTVVRIHDDGRVPTDNPFVNTPSARPEIFSYGHRNIQGLALHPETQMLWSHEHGPQGGDEFNAVSTGKNYGWPIITYGVNYVIGTSIGEGTSKEGMEQPAHYWVPSIAPSGLAFYDGQWLVGALKYRLLATLTPAGSHYFIEKRFLQNQWGRIRDVKVNGDKIYLLTNASKGKLLRVTFSK